MNLILDNIIFSIQRAGGISVVWYELLKRILDDQDFNYRILEEPNQNLFRQKLIIPESRFLINPLSKYPVSIQRYLNPNKLNVPGIFHSSYYRSVRNSSMINVTTVHDFTYEYYRKGLPKLVHQIQKSKAIKNSKRIICVSHNTKSDLLKFYPEINEKQLKVIYNGVDNIYRPLTKKDDTQLKQLVPFSSREFVLYVGDRKGIYKNFIVAVNACKIANIPLVIVGGGLLTDEENILLKDTIGKNKFKLFLGIDNDQLNLLYNHALCLLYPSLYEGFGIPIIEAQKAGCPVISTDYSSIPEVAGDGAFLLKKVNKFVIADILKQLILNSPMVARLRDNGLKNSQRFSWEICYQETKKVYKEVYEEYLK
jgi:glycosyltransferase involved in cell wall biosynthesis